VTLKRLTAALFTAHADKASKDPNTGVYFVSARLWCVNPLLFPFSATMLGMEAEGGVSYIISCW